MGDTAKAAGVGPTIEWKGRDYRFSTITPVVIGRFEVWLEDCGWNATARYALNHSPAETKRQEDAHRRDCATDVYSHGSEYFQRGSVTINGLKQVTLICLQEGNPGDPSVNAELVESMFKEKGKDVRRCLTAIDWAVFEAPDGTNQHKAVGAGP